MVWIVLALLGVPVWLIAIGITAVVYRNRALRSRPGNMAVRLRKSSGKRWVRGNAIWIHDVFAFRGSPAAWREALLWVSAISSRSPAGDDAHKLRRMDHPVIGLFAIEDGTTVEVAADGDRQATLLGPFDAAVATGPG